MKNAVHLMVQEFLSLQGDEPLAPEEYFAKAKYGSLVTRFFGSWEGLVRAAGKRVEEEKKHEKREPKILLFDLETAPLELLGFGLYDQNFGLNQIKRDWFLLSIAGKWLGQPAIIYADQSKEPELGNDKRLLSILWQLLDEADIVITQNGKKFDAKVANARFVIEGFSPCSPYKHIDTLQLAKRNFKFTSNKLEYMAQALGVAVKKSQHKAFPGFELWKECLNGNPEAWKEMHDYNIADVLALEGVYLKLRPWGTPGVDMNVFHGDPVFRCSVCASTNLHMRGTETTSSGMFKRFVCLDCGKWGSAKGAGNNLFSLKKKMSLKGPPG